MTWAEKYNRYMSLLWNQIPERVTQILVTVSIFLLGISINGEWLVIFVHLSHQWGYHQNLLHPNNTSPNIRWSELSLEILKLKDLSTFWMMSCAISYSMYFLIGGFIHWHYYVRQRDKAKEWKCQPTKWLSPELEKHEILFGSFTLFFNATISALVACYIYNGGYSTIYYRIDEYGYFWFVVQFAVIFIYQDYCTYWLHRLYHLPFLYKNFHKLHHKYKQPTAFSVTAIHPVESLHIQSVLLLPLFFVPIHWVPFYTSAFYAYYHGIIDHSGVNFKAQWWQPWQPDAIFHDNHHQYFHVNFAFNIEFWDKLHGTYRRKDRIYREDTFYGKGKSIHEVSKEELIEDMLERTSENPRAYRDNQLKYKLTAKELSDLQ